MLASLALMMAAAQPQLPAVPVLPKPKLICREDERQVGSHIHTGRRCKTEEDWRIEDGRLDPTASPSLRITEGQGDSLTPRQRPPL